METNDLQNIWKNVDSEINLKSADELNQILSVKIRKTINKFLVILSIDIIVCVGLIVFLIITILNRQGDVLYLINNLTLCLITVIALITSVIAWYKMHNNRYNQPLKSWLEERIISLSKKLTGKFSRLYLYLIPILYILIVLSIHVYFENKLFIDVLKTEESIAGLIVGTPIGLFVSYFGAKKIRKYYSNNLEYLKTLYSSLL